MLLLVVFIEIALRYLYVIVVVFQEVNPLAETPDGKVVVCDAKINFDDNAEFRQKQVFSYRDRSQEDPREVIHRAERTLSSTYP